MLSKGLIQVYTGNSEQTNFAPVGLSLRAAGHSLRTYMACFLPDVVTDRAKWIPDIMKPFLVIDHTKIERTPGEGKWRSGEIGEINDILQRVRKVLQGGTYDIVVLHEINRIAAQGLIRQDEIMALLKEKPDHVELVFTGSGASENLIKRADLVTEMVCHRNDSRDDHDLGLDTIHPSEVVTGNGKGKTTYCLGKALLASDPEARSIILQFIKSPKAYGEVKAIETLPCMEIKTMGEGFLNKESATSNKLHRRAAKKAWEECLREIFSLKYGVVVLDEINIATYYGLINAERVREMLFLKPEKVHLILSGRNAHLEVKEGATTVIEMREIKHPYKKGIKARKGIEF